MYFHLMGEKGHEQLVFCHDPSVGLRAIIAVHSTVLGPSLGGCRFRPYQTEREAVIDVLRLAEGMTLKASAAGLDLGGGKAVIFGDPAVDKSEELLRAFGRHVDALGGRYITAEDVGTTREDMDLIRRETKWVTGVSDVFGGGGDPSPATAYGVLQGMHATALSRWGDDSLHGRHVAVQGAGKVGAALVGLLVEAGCRVTVADVDQAVVQRCVREHGCESTGWKNILSLDCDILAPCALGGVFSLDNLDWVKAQTICGAANNQLVTADVAVEMSKRGILYAPDFIVNSGGIISVGAELEGYNAERVRQQCDGIRDTTLRVLGEAEEAEISTDEAGKKIAWERVEKIARVHRIRRPF